MATTASTTSHGSSSREAATTIEVIRADGTVRIPAAVFDNRTDHTSFLRADPSEWDPTQVANLHAELETAFTTLR